MVEGVDGWRDCGIDVVRQVVVWAVGGMCPEVAVVECVSEDEGGRLGVLDVFGSAGEGLVGQEPRWVGDVLGAVEEEEGS